MVLGRWSTVLHWTVLCTADMHSICHTQLTSSYISVSLGCLYNVSLFPLLGFLIPPYGSMRGIFIVYCLFVILYVRLRISQRWKKVAAWKFACQFDYPRWTSPILVNFGSRAVTAAALLPGWAIEAYRNRSGSAGIGRRGSVAVGIGGGAVA